MSVVSSFARLQAAIDNTLDLEAVGERFFCGIVGDRPSQYAKSPSIWNPTLSALGMDVVYLAFDVQPARLSETLDTLREHPRFLGGNVTVPHKSSIMPYLDEIDGKARQIGAVNTITRTVDGRLVGSNTDGKGAVDALTKLQPGASAPLVESLSGMNVLMIGAGGAARATAAYLAAELDTGTLTIVNRSQDAAETIAAAVAAAGATVQVATTDAVAQIAPKSDLIINCSSVGQSGVRSLADGSVTVLEPFSPLAPFEVPSIRGAGDTAEVHRAFMQCSLEQVARNNDASLRVATATPSSVLAMDIVYAPLETTFLRHARLTGHRTANGKAMNVNQAVDAMFSWVCASYFDERRLRTPETRQKIAELMYRAW